MLVPPPAILVQQAATGSRSTVSTQLTAAKAIATYELASWRKTHPKADLAVTFSDPAISPAQADLFRSRLGFKSSVPVLDTQVLTLVFDALGQPARNKLSMDAYVFLGSFPQGFFARYQIRTSGKEARVLSRTILQRYEIPPAKPSKSIT